MKFTDNPVAKVIFLFIHLMKICLVFQVLKDCEEPQEIVVKHMEIRTY